MSVFIASLVLWLFLTNFSYQELIVGILVSIAVASVFKNYHKIKFDGKLLVRLFKFIFIYLPVFIVEMIKANFDVAARVLNPKLPLNPGFVKIKTDLNSEVSKLFLANSITLTPGTLTVDGKDDHLYIHWIDVKTTKKKEEAISAKFEKILKGVFE